MKSDMAGAAAVVVQATLAIAELGLPVKVTHARPDGREHARPATPPGPATSLTMYGGTTVEVLNTDAEGRLVLADALVPATEERRPT